jgi:hypothetical protein
MVSGLGVRYDMGSDEYPLLDRRVPPDWEVELPDGSRMRVAELIRPDGYLARAAPGSGDLHRALDRRLGTGRTVLPKGAATCPK